MARLAALDPMRTPGLTAANDRFEPKADAHLVLGCCHAANDCFEPEADGFSVVECCPAANVCFEPEADVFSVLGCCPAANDCFEPKAVRRTGFGSLTALGKS